MAYRSKYTGRYGGMGRMLSRPWLHRPCKEAAVKIMAAAQANSPTGTPPDDRHPGLYRASFDVVPIFKNVPFRGKPRNRSGARVMNTAPHARIVEYGNSKTPRFAVFRTAIDDVKAANRVS
ncbi:HK97 gp10 family phage protein [Streptomyces asiaticus]|uniref:HK97 gp10 family phage protein n=1 Tax=Streptomyces asiaticus TaxID=114695 RepID=UPI001BA6F2EF|nr:HK97 gp10 family phage protein [Streptomyces asiaticus]